MRCQYNSDKFCNDCDEHSIACDECKFIDQEGDCDNSESVNHLRFMDGLSVCCSLFKKRDSK